MQRNSLVGSENGRRRRFARSHSYSEIPQRKIELKQQYTVTPDGSRLIRQFSSEEIRNDGHIRVLQVFRELHILRDSHVSSKKTELSCINQYEEHNTKRLVDFTEQTSVMSLPELTEVPKKNSEWCKILFLPILVSFFSIMFFETYFAVQKGSLCTLKYEASLAELNNYLKLNVYGQRAAIFEIYHEFQNFEAATELRQKTLLFYGDTGVGKSYTASLIAEHFQQAKNVLYLISSSYKDIETVFDEILKGLTNCGDNLVIIDGVTEFYFKEVVLFVNGIKHKINENIRVLMIVVFSFHENEIPENIDTESRLMKIQLVEFKLHEVIKMYGVSEFKLIYFRHLEKDHINLCIRKALIEQNKELKHDIVQTIYDSLFVYSGCKGISSKIQLL